MKLTFDLLDIKCDNFIILLICVKVFIIIEKKTLFAKMLVQGDVLALKEFSHCISKK